MKRRFPNVPMINDPSHICGRRDILQEVAQQAIDLDFDGLIIESHIDPDNAWIRDFGAATFNVKTVAQNAWEGSFTQSKMFLTEGCEYTFEFTLRTEAPSIKPNVIVFGENTSGVSFFEEEVDLNQTSTTYSFTVIPETSDYASTGVYFGGSKGMVIIEGIDIQRNPIGTN